MDTHWKESHETLQARLESLLDKHPGVDDTLRAEVLSLFAQKETLEADACAVPDNLLEDAADVIFVHDLKGHILAVNAVACQRLGYERSELIGTKVSHLAYDYDRELYRRRRDRVLARKSYAFETKQRHKDGTPVPLEINARVVEYQGQQAILSIARDLTARKAAEAIMLEQKLFLAAILEHLPVGLAIKRVEPGFSVHMWNPVMTELTGYAREEVLGKNDFDLFSPDLAAQLRAMDERAVENDAIVDQAEVTIHNKNGHFMARYITVPLHDGEGRPEAVLVMMMDVTERIVAEKQLLKAHEELERRVEERTAELQRAHDQLMETEEHYRALYEQSSEAIFVINEDGRILHANPKALDIFGYDVSEMRKMTPLELIHPDEAGAAPEVLGAVRRGEIIHMELRMQRKDGSFAQVEMAAKRIAGNHVLATLWDITERKRMEQELRAAKVAAERANEAKSEFLANMSHEIRTPMGGILGMTDMVLSMDLSKDQREYLNGIKSASLSLLDIINDILDFSKIEANKMDLVMEPFDLAGRVAGLCETFRVEASGKGIELSCRVDPKLPEIVTGDAGRLGQVLANLLSNAIKFTDKGCVELDVSVLEHTGGRATVRFSVTDTGIGIAEEERAKLFDVFSQLDTSFSKRQPGTGLGLAISRRLVEMMGGYIYLESEPGQGSKFSFTLFMQTPEQAESVPEQEEHGLTALDGSDTVRVLLAEDNLLNQEFLTHFLEEAGHSVHVAENGLIVLEALAEKAFDIILMDIQMPEMDGIKATQEIRAHDGSVFDPKIPIIALTAYAMKGDKERMIAAGMNDYLSKPVDMPKLLSLICKLVGSNGA